jgi:phenylacetate-CoA ligase
MKLCPEPEALARRRCPEATQLAALNRVLDATWAGNLFYAGKWRAAGVPAAPLEALADLRRLPFTTRAELVADQSAAPPLGLNITGERGRLIRHHRSSGTTREPILWADSVESWRWVLRGSEGLWRLAGVRRGVRVLFLMPFGASSGPWIIYEGACALGCECLPPGAAEVAEQLRWLLHFRPAVVAGKPSAIETLGTAALAAGNDPAKLGVTKLILCGPRDPAQRAALQRLWAAECFDRYGLTEAGSVAGECSAESGHLHVLDECFIAECIHPETAQPVTDGEAGELVLTTLGRIARPIIRYRTGDSVRLISNHQCRCGRRGPALQGEVRRLSRRA